MKLLSSIIASLMLCSSVSEACPSWANDGYRANLSGSNLRGSGQVFRVQAGGNQRLAGCPIPFGSDRGDGYVTRDPDFTFQINGLSQYKLVFSTYSECDSVLVLNTGNDNWFYDDDDNTDSHLDSRIILTRPRDGIYDVWIGTHDGSVCDAALAVQTIRR